MPWGALRSSASPNNRTEQLVPRPPSQKPGQTRPLAGRARAGSRAGIQMPTNSSSSIILPQDSVKPCTQQKDDLGIPAVSLCIHKTPNSSQQPWAASQSCNQSCSCPAQDMPYFYHIYIGGDTFSPDWLLLSMT